MRRTHEVSGTDRVRRSRAAGGAAAVALLLMIVLAACGGSVDRYKGNGAVAADASSTTARPSAAPTAAPVSAAPSLPNQTTTPGATVAPIAATGYPSDPNVPNWKRKYLPDTPLDEGPQGIAMVGACYDDVDNGVKQNDAKGPTIAVLGDSAVDLIRPHALKDNAYHWVFASHCGEKFGTVLENGRLKAAMSTNPDVLVINLGSNNTSEAWALKPELVEPGLKDLNRLLDATDNVKCRVVVDLPAIPHPKDPPEDGQLRVQLTTRINDGLHAAASRPGVHVVRWSDTVNANRNFIFDHAHPTPAGINAMINTIIEASQPCLGGGATLSAPAQIDISPDDDGDYVTWTPISTADASYFVESSDGRSATTKANALIFPRKSPDVRLQYRVTATAGGGTSAPTAWVTAPEPRRLVDTLLGILAVLLVVAGWGAGIAVFADFLRVVHEQKQRWFVVHDVGLMAAGTGWLILGNMTMAIFTLVWLVGASLWYLLSSADGPSEESAEPPPAGDESASRPRETQLV